MNTERPPHTQHFRLPKCAIGTRVDGTGASFGVYASRLACVHAKVGVTKPCISPHRKHVGLVVSGIYRPTQCIRCSPKSGFQFLLSQVLALSVADRQLVLSTRRMKLILGRRYIHYRIYSQVSG